MPLIFIVIIIVLLLRPTPESKPIYIDLTADMLATLNHGGSVYGDYDRKIMISPPRR